MPNRCSRRQFLINALGGTFATATVGCGTVLHPERRGQPAGELDWSIVALDAVGLLLFFVPGVIAFAVDFNNGTIYLPPEEYGKADGELTPTKIPADELSRERIEEIVSQHTQTRVRLAPGQYRAVSLNRIAEFPEESRSIATSGGHSRVQFRCQSPQ